MPSIKVKCPICSEKVSDNCLGGHFLSKTHANHLRSTNDKLREFLTRLKANDYMLNGKNAPPLFKVSTGHSFHLCLSCKKCYKEGCGRETEHYDKSPTCKESAVKELEAFLFPTEKSSGTSKESAAEIAKLQAENNIYKNASDSFKKKYYDADARLDELKELLNSMVASSFDISIDGNIQKLKNYLESEGGSNKYYYDGRFEFTGTED